VENHHLSKTPAKQHHDDDDDDDDGDNE